MVIFNSYETNYQRVKCKKIPLNHHFHMVFRWFCYRLMPIPQEKAETLPHVSAPNRWGVWRPRHHIAEAKALHVRRVTLQANQVTMRGLGGKEFTHDKLALCQEKNGGLYGILGEITIDIL